MQKLRTIIAILALLAFAGQSFASISTVCMHMTTGGTAGQTADVMDHSAHMNMNMKTGTHNHGEQQAQADTAPKSCCDDMQCDQLGCFTAVKAAMLVGYSVEPEKLLTY